MILVTRFTARDANLDAQVIGKPARIARQAPAHFLLEESAEKVALEHGGIGRGGANDDLYDIVGKQPLSAGALDLLLSLVQPGDADLGHFRRIANGLRHRAEGRFEYSAAEAF